jgi:long-chain acyl-CoA synthetase
MMKENFVQFVENSIKKNWSLNAFADYKGESMTYADVAERIAKLHLVFEAFDVKKGDKVALFGKNATHWGVAYLATVTYGAVTVPILPDFKANDVHHIVNHSDSVLLFAADFLFDALDESKMENVRGTISLANFSLLGVRKPEKVAELMNKLDNKFKEKFGDPFTPESIHFPEVKNDSLAVISYTSGTTGFSKGVMIPHNSLIANVVYANNNMPLEPGDAIVSFLPLAHAYGCAFEFLWPFTLGCHITFLTKTPSPQIILQAFKEIKPRLVLSVPLVIEKIYKKQLLPAISKSHMKALLAVPGLNSVIHKKIRQKLVDVFGGNFHEVVIGGAALNKDVELFFNKIRFPFSIGYGMTECGPLISYANWDKTKLGSAGKLVDNMEVKIDSPDPYNEVGEIMIRGENVMYGYYKNDEATKQALDNEGWLHTGDLGLIDKENFIFIKGRSKSMILGPSGQNIYPEEIEAKYNNMQFVMESVVIEKNEKLVALIYPDYELLDKQGVSEAELIKILDEKRKQLNNDMPAYMNVSAIKLHPEEFEKTPKKSIKRFLYTIED